MSQVDAETTHFPSFTEAGFDKVNMNKSAEPDSNYGDGRQGVAWSNKGVHACYISIYQIHYN